MWPPVVEPRYITSPASDFTDSESANPESDLTDNYSVTSSKEGGVT